MPSRVINIASVAGIATSDVTSTDDGGLSAPGHGTFSCAWTLHRRGGKTDLNRWPVQGCLHTSVSDPGGKACASEYYGQLCLSVSLQTHHSAISAMPSGYSPAEEADIVGRGVFPSRMSNYGIDKFLDTLLERQPTGRVGKPSDFAGLILFLSSYGAAHMTGNVIEIDGGSVRSGWRSSRRRSNL